MSKRAITVSVLSWLSLSSCLAGQKIVQHPKPDPCQQKASAAYAEGMNAGFSEGYKTGSELAKIIYTTPIGEVGKPLKISLIVEDINGADAYKFAASEVIRTQFAESLVVDPTGDSDLVLWISGTNGPGSSGEPNTQAITMTVQVNLSHSNGG